MEGERLTAEEFLLQRVRDVKVGETFQHEGNTWMKIRVVETLSSRLINVVCVAGNKLGRASYIDKGQVLDWISLDI